MSLKALLKPVLLYTGLLGLLTVATVYLATHSGLYILGLAAGGLLLAVLGGGTAGRVSTGGAEHADGGADGVEVEATGMMPHTNTDTSLRLVLLCYGGGVFLWSFTALFTLTETLV